MFIEASSALSSCLFGLRLCGVHIVQSLTSASAFTALIFKHLGVHLILKNQINGKVTLRSRSHGIIKNGTSDFQKISVFLDVCFGKIT